MKSKDCVQWFPTEGEFLALKFCLTKIGRECIANGEVQYWELGKKFYVQISCRLEPILHFLNQFTLL